MSTLYELTNSYLEVLELAEQLDAEALKDTLDSIDEAIEESAEFSYEDLIVGLKEVIELLEEVIANGNIV